MSLRQSFYCTNFVTMKNGIVILTYVLSVLMLYHTTRVSFTYVYYELDPVNFIEKLCINKDKPELACLGKCHLKKISQESSDSSEPGQVINFDELLLFAEAAINYHFSSNFTTHKRPIISYVNLYRFHYESSFFHPPQL